MKTVSFDPVPVIFFIVSSEDRKSSYASARADEMRFRRRIENTEALLKNILRQKIVKASIL